MTEKDMLVLDIDRETMLLLRVLHEFYCHGREDNRDGIELNRFTERLLLLGMQAYLNRRLKGQRPKPDA